MVVVVVVLVVVVVVLVVVVVVVVFVVVVDVVVVVVVVVVDVVEVDVMVVLVFDEVVVEVVVVIHSTNERGPAALHTPSASSNTFQDVASVGHIETIVPTECSFARVVYHVCANIQADTKLLW